MKRNIIHLTFFVFLAFFSKSYCQELIPGTTQQPAIIEDSTKGSLESKLESMDRDKKNKSKKICQITTTYGKEVEIDKGWLHKVNKHDIYAVKDISNEVKGKLEVEGVGYDKSIGKIFYQKKDEIKPGDFATYLGRRKPFGYGLVLFTPIDINIGFENEPVDPILESQPGLSRFGASNYGMSSSGGGGYFLTFAFKNKWDLQILLGVITSNKNKNAFHNEYVEISNIESKSYYYRKEKWYNAYYSPLVQLKKNVFYPYGWFSPYVGINAGYYFCEFSNNYTENYDHYVNNTLASDSWKKSLQNNTDRVEGILFAPVVGLELFSSNAIHVLVDAKYVYSPELSDKTNGDKYSFRNFIFSGGLTYNF